MAPPDLAATNTWLAVIAIASLVQLILFVVAAFIAYRAYRDTTRQLEEFNRRQLEPTVARLNAALGDVREVLDRVKSADDGLRQVIDRTGAAMQRAAWVARSRVWPMLGLIRGVRAAVARLTQDPHPRLEGRTSGPDVRVRS